MLLKNNYKNSPVAVTTRNYKKAIRTGEEKFLNQVYDTN